MRPYGKVQLTAPILLILFAGTLAAAVLHDNDDIYLQRTPREIGLWMMAGTEQDSARHSAGKAMVALDRGVVGAQSMPLLGYTGAGSAPPQPLPPAERIRRVGNIQEWAAAMRDAGPGDRIVLKRGHYEVRELLRSHRAGSPQQPVVVVAEDPANTLITVQTIVGIQITHAHWQFHNLTMEGQCRSDSECEHAFHIKGPAHHFLLRNSLLRDFNAHLKINRESNAQPDHGEMAYTTLTYTRIRRTPNPTTAFDMLAGAGWRVHHNHVSDFVNTDPTRTTYGMFAKGGAVDTVFDSNTIFCEHHLRGAPGQRVGLSFGGGGTSPQVCRNGERCAAGEHEGGEMRNNLIVGCSGVGIYLNRAFQAVVRHNTLLDAGGIHARFTDTVARIEANWNDGPVRTRDGATVLTGSGDQAEPLWRLYSGWNSARRAFRDVSTLDLRWLSDAPARAPSSLAGAQDLCGAIRPAEAARPGAFEDYEACQVRRGSPTVP